MIHICYMGIVFSLVFYVVFGVAVRLMDLDSCKRNRYRLFVLITSVSLFFIFSLAAGILHLSASRILYGLPFVVLSGAALFVLISIIIELRNIKARKKMRKFMILFDIVEKYIAEGKTREEILGYLTDSQNLGIREAQDFLDFISEPDNHQFLADVNEKIREARLLGRIR